MPKLFDYLRKINNWLLIEIRYDARTQIGIVLFFLSFLALIQNRSADLIFKYFIVLFAAGITDLLFLKHKKGKWLFPHSSLVTGLLIFLILNPKFNILLFGLTAIIAISVKNLVFINRHIFNPAALGLILISFFFDDAITWWGVSLNPLVILPIVIGAGFVLLRIKRILLPLTFLTCYTAFLILSARFSSISQLIDPSLFLFAFVMLPEPQTSPIIGHWRYFFGPLVALIWLILSMTKIAFWDILLTSLIVANLITTIAKKINQSTFPLKS